MKVIVAGSRSFDDYPILKRELDAVKDQIDVVISGGARGADSLGERWAKENGKTVWNMPADWSTGKSAGHIRNVAMGMRADAAFVFWDGESRGSRHMIETMMKMKNPCRVIQYLNEQK